MEIERKWRMTRAPELPERTHSRIEQSYLSVTPEVRIRKYEDLLHGAPERYDLTIKSEGTLVREEIIKPLTAEEYRALLGMLHGAEPIVKEHFTYDLEGLILEFSSVDARRETAFTYAEAEFSSVEAAMAFVPPAWFGEEVTEQPDFRMKCYWQQTRLKG